MLFLALKQVFIIRRDWDLTFAVSKLLPSNGWNISEFTYNSWFATRVGRACDRWSLISKVIQVIWILGLNLIVKVISRRGLLVTTSIIDPQKGMRLFLGYWSYILILFKLVWEHFWSLHVNWMNWIGNIVFRAILRDVIIVQK